MKTIKMMLALMAFVFVATIAGAQQTQPTPANDQAKQEIPVKKDTDAKPSKDKAGKDVVKSKEAAKTHKGKGHAYGKHKGDMKGKEFGKNRAEEAHQKKTEKNAVKEGKGKVETDEAGQPTEKMKDPKKMGKKTEGKNGKKPSGKKTEEQEN